MTQEEYRRSHVETTRRMAAEQKARDRQHNYLLRKLKLRLLVARWMFWRLAWWRPCLVRHKLSTGPYGGWHFSWGPFHAWDVMTHHKKRERGYKLG